MPSGWGREGAGLGDFAQHKDLVEAAVLHVEDVTRLEQGVLLGGTGFVHGLDVHPVGGALAGEQHAAVVGLGGKAAGTVYRFEYGERDVGDFEQAGLDNFAHHVHALAAEGGHAMFLWAPIPERFAGLGSVGFSKLLIEKAGDLVNMDVSAEKDGYWADCGMSIGIPPITPERQKMLDMTRGAFDVAFEAAKAGVYVYEVGRAVEKFIVRNGYQVLDQLGGHGVGRGIHEAPSIPNWYNRTMRQKLEENGVITLEPFLSTRTRVVMQMPDGWTLKTSDGSLATQYEHTVIITKNKPILVTAIE